MRNLSETCLPDASVYLRVNRTDLVSRLQQVLNEIEEERSGGNE